MKLVEITREVPLNEGEGASGGQLEIPITNKSGNGWLLKTISNTFAVETVNTFEFSIIRRGVEIKVFKDASTDPHETILYHLPNEMKASPRDILRIKNSASAVSTVSVTLIGG